MAYNLHMVLLGCKPEGRYTEQHDLFFGIGKDLADLKPAMIDFWPEAAGKLHVDAWRCVTQVAGYNITIAMRSDLVREEAYHLFFVNLGGYRGNDFEEYHYKQLVVARDLADAAKKAKTNQFYKDHVSPHIDDKYGLDVDDAFTVEEALPAAMREKFQLVLTPTDASAEDPVHIGYLKFTEL